MFGWRRRPAKTNGQVGLAPLPAFGTVGAGYGGWKPYIPGAGANTQVGQYSQPPRTQAAGYWPDVQLRCGVEGINRNWGVLSPNGADIPWFQAQPYPQNPRHLLWSGGRSGGVFGLTSLASLFGPKEYAQQLQQQALADGTLGN